MTDRNRYTTRSAANRARRKMKDGDVHEVQPDGGKFVIVASPTKTRANELKAIRAAARAKARAKTKAARNGHAKPGRAPAGERAMGQRAQIVADAEAGKLPPVPNFSAETHRPFRKRLDELVALVKAKDIKGLQAVEIKPYQTSRKAMFRYRNLAVTALKAQAKEARS